MKRRDMMQTLVQGAAGALALSTFGPGALAAEPSTILAPLRNTRWPKFRAPAGATDTQCHIFGPAAKYPYSARRSYTPPDSTLEDLRKLHATLGIARAVLVNASIYGTDSRVIVDAVAAGAGRYRGCVNIDDSVTDAQLAAMNAAGISACRFNFVRHLGGAPDMAMFDRSMQRASKLGWHVLLHIDAPDLPGLLSMIQKLPLPYVIDHMARVMVKNGLDQAPFRALVNLAARDPRCYVKLSSAERLSATGYPFEDVAPFARQLVEAAPDRCIWGSDWPHPNLASMPNDGDLFDLIPAFAPEAGMQKALLVDNPMRLYQFEA
jgi:2-pyrone-4,6-dicarboxylate lactonase